MTGLALAGMLGVGTLAGAGLGFGLSRLVTRDRRRVSYMGATSENEREPLSDRDRQQIAADFAVHTASIRQQVSGYADVLADGDPVLRERLRQFEHGASQ